MPATRPAHKVAVEAFSELLQILYSAPLHPEQWQRFLTHLCKYTGFEHGFFFTASLRTGFVEIVEGGTPLDRMLMQEYANRYQNADPFRTALIAVARQRDPTGIYSEEDLIPANKYLTHSIREIHVPMNFRYCALIAANISIRRLEAISIWRGEQEGPLEPDSRHFLELLLPHIRTALDFRQALGEARRKSALAELLANANPDPVFALRADGRIKSTNVAGEQLLRARNGLSCVDGRLVATNSAQAGDLSALLKSSAGNNVLCLQRAEHTRPLQLIASPLAEADRSASGADVMLLVNDPDRPVVLSDEVLRRLYRFTPAETEIACGLLMGYSPSEISSLRRVAPSTVRQQVKAMLEKTGCGHRADMVRLLMALAHREFPPEG